MNPEVIVPEFATLDEIDPRRAWTHEALAFTPWLAANLDRLGKAVGIELEFEKAEVAVGRFAADIIARDMTNGSTVLIENQLECSDHRHLGQILTYLTGLKAETILWVAPEFREEHLSALRWLNENTKEPFAFFAVRVRVVRIAQSPLAPLFEVIERPNTWDRRIAETAREAAERRDVSPEAMSRRAFWARYAERVPQSAADSIGGGGVSRWRKISGTDLVVSQWLAANRVGVFVRGGRGVNGPAIFDQLVPFQEQLLTSLGVDLGSRNEPLSQRLEADTLDERQWDRLIDWLNEHAEQYANVLAGLFTDSAIENEIIDPVGR